MRGRGRERAGGWGAVGEVGGKVISPRLRTASARLLGRGGGGGRGGLHIRAVHHSPLLIFVRLQRCLKF